MELNKVPSLFKTCVRTISRSLPEFEKEDQFLEVLPSHIKNSIIKLVTKVFGGIQSEKLFTLLLNPELEKIDLTICIVTDKVLEDLCRCKRLKHLTFPPLTGAECSKEALCDLIPNLRNLETLDLRGSLIVDDYVVSLIAKHCKGLHLLDIEKCSGITDAAMTYLKDMPLKQLGLGYTPISDNAITLMDGTVLEDHLEELNIKECDLSVAGLTQLRWDKIKYIRFKVRDHESKNKEPEQNKGTGLCWFHRDIVLA